MTEPDRNDIAYWYPLLASTGVRAPRTEILTTGYPFEAIMDGDRRTAAHRAAMADLIFAVHDAAMAVGGYPAFLRSGHMSGKHDFDNACRLTMPRDIEPHLYAIAERSILADVIGLPTATWAVREWLTLPHRFTVYNGMPLALEARAFVRDGRVECVHPYWPDAAVEAGRPVATTVDGDWRAQLASHRAFVLQQGGVLGGLAERAGAPFDGLWSVDFARDVSGWAAIDMAEGERSFHWPECPRCPEEQLAIERGRAARAASDAALFGAA